MMLTSRLRLIPITLGVVEAVMEGRRAETEALVGARLPKLWPGRDLIERAFSAQLERIRDNPSHRLWGDRVMVTRDTGLIVGSVVFHGGPDASGEVEIAYGVEAESQGMGYATEGTGAALAWALEQPEVVVVKAITPPFHRASQRVLEKIGMTKLGTVAHDMFGEVLEYERRR